MLTYSEIPQSQDEVMQIFLSPSYSANQGHDHAEASEKLTNPLFASHSGNVKLQISTFSEQLIVSIAICFVLKLNLRTHYRGNLLIFNHSK